MLERPDDDLPAFDHLVLMLDLPWAYLVVVVGGFDAVCQRLELIDQAGLGSAIGLRPL